MKFTALHPGDRLEGAGGGRHAGTPRTREPVLAWGQRCSHSLRGALARSRTVSELARLDDRMLRDIGIERGQIREVVDSMLRKPVPARPAHGRSTREPLAPHPAA